MLSPKAIRVLLADLPPTDRERVQAALRDSVRDADYKIRVFNLEMNDEPNEELTKLMSTPEKYQILANQRMLTETGYKVAIDYIEIGSEVSELIKKLAPMKKTVQAAATDEAIPEEDGEVLSDRPPKKKKEEGALAADPEIGIEDSLDFDDSGDGSKKPPETPEPTPSP